MGVVIFMNQATNRNSHHLWMRWLKLRARNALCAEWHEEFWNFVNGVGDPGNSNKLSRPNTKAPYGPGNFQWSVPLTPERKLEYFRQWNRANSETQYHKRVMKRYGVTPEHYIRLTSSHGGCAICGKTASEPTRRGGSKHKRLAIDHCHTTGQVRGLLCTDCNVMIGLADDDETVLSAAIEYLRHHRRKRLKVVE